MDIDESSSRIGLSFARDPARSSVDADPILDLLPPFLIESQGEFVGSVWREKLVNCGCLDLADVGYVGVSEARQPLAQRRMRGVGIVLAAQTGGGHGAGRSYGCDLIRDSRERR